MKIRSIVMALGLIIYNVAYAKKIGICKVIDHEAIDSVVKGIESVVLKDNKIEIISCQGNPALASQIGAKFVNNDFDVIVTVGTTPSQAIAKYAKEDKTKLVFSSVTNPSKLIGNNSSNITGVSNFVDLKPQIKIILEIQPKLKNLGIIYNIGEENSLYIIEMKRNLAS